MPRMIRIMPVIMFKSFGSALFAKRAAILAQISVKTIQRIRIVQSGAPSMIKWLTEPVSAVNVIIKTLVPTAVFNS